MKIAISATNPCHLYDLARELHARGALGAYFSGYPGWRLHPPAGFPLRAHSARTLVTYGLLRLPAALRPPSHRLFRWQDAGFDRAVAGDLSRATGEIVHAMPGQARETFRAARRAGVETCLNHASGPVRQQLAIMRREWAAAGLDERRLHAFDESYFAREREEYALADWHCVASTRVRDQLVAEGVPAARIWVAPYGADPAVFHPPAAGSPPRENRVVFAGQLTLRKGLGTLFDAFRRLPAARATGLDCFGPPGADAPAILAAAAGDPRIRFPGSLEQAGLAARFRRAALLVLPSWEEAFGLVVPQALSCGLPCLVSDRVGARDLVRHRRNGSIFPAGDAAALGAEIAWWLDHAGAFEPSPQPWSEPAAMLLRLMADRHARQPA